MKPGAATRHRPGRRGLARALGTAVLALGLLSPLGLLAAVPTTAPPRAPITAPAPAPAFDFVALGDMPYGDDVAVGPAYRRLIEIINRIEPVFSVHIGDFKAGIAPCSDAEYARQAGHFQLFERPLVFTPGDNDWLDCQRRGADPLERLQALRQRFFPAARSLGRQPMAVLRQGDQEPAHAAFVENQRWQHAGVVFATFHTLGPDNGSTEGPPLAAEHQQREAANAAWLQAAFATARQAQARALVLFTQAETLHYSDTQRRARTTVRAGFELSIRDTLLPLAQAAPFPVLLVHGDHHSFYFDQPFFAANGQRIPNLWRLQVYGEPRMHAVRVRVAGGRSTMPFTIHPVWNPMSPDPRLRGR